MIETHDFLGYDIYCLLLNLLFFPCLETTMKEHPNVTGHGDAVGHSDAVLQEEAALAVSSYTVTDGTIGHWLQ